jgi:hypothetical protein
MLLDLQVVSAPATPVVAPSTLAVAQLPKAEVFALELVECHSGAVTSWTAVLVEEFVGKQGELRVYLSDGTLRVQLGARQLDAVLAGRRCVVSVAEWQQPARTCFLREAR